MSANKANKKDELKGRWQGLEVDFSRGSPFGLTEDVLVDYRGIRFPKRIDGQKFKNCDFSFAGFNETRMGQMKFENCVFNKTDFSDIFESNGHYVNCRFLQSKFSRAYLGYETSRYTDCVFDNPKISRPTIFKNAVFRNVEFLNCNLKGVDFNASGFWSCRFEGKINDIWFKGTYQHASDLEKHTPVETGLHDVSFENCEVEWITLSNGCVIENVSFRPSNYVKALDFTRFVQEFESMAEVKFAAHEIGKVLGWFEVKSGHSKGQPRTLVTRSSICSMLGETMGYKVYEMLTEYEVSVSSSTSNAN